MKLVDFVGPSNQLRQRLLNCRTTRQASLDEQEKTYGHDIDTAKLLSDHDGPSSDISPPQSGDGEDISESGKVVGSFERILLLKDLAMCVELSLARPNIGPGNRGRTISLAA